MGDAPDLIVTGRIASLAGADGFGWVEAIAIRGGRVVAAGSTADLAALGGAGTKRLSIDPDRVVVPGLTDAHLHLADAALAAERIDLEGSATLEDGLRAIELAADREPDPDRWLEGGGWDPGRWGRWPTAADLGETGRDRRVALWSHDHHALWVSERVLRELGLAASVVDPPGGSFRRVPDGAPDGVLQENAVQAVVSRLPGVDRARLERSIAAYARGLVALGIVAIHDPGDLLADQNLEGGFGAILALADRGELPIRVHCSIREPALAVATDRRLRTGAALGDDHDSRARMGWLKLFADGALGSRTAQLLEPYEGSEAQFGVAVTSAARLTSLARRAAEAGIVAEIHAIGDAALRSVIAVLEPVAPRNGPMARIEHVQFADPADLPRMARARIAASIQPVHLRSDAAKAREAWGDRAERRAFLLRSLLEARVTVAFGTDAPVEPADPWPGIAIAVTRRAASWDDPRPFGPAEAISLAEALRAAAIGPAEMAGEPDRGRLTPGSRADFVTVPAAALREPVEPGGALWTARPTLVAIDGRVVHEA